MICSFSIHLRLVTDFYISMNISLEHIFNTYSLCWKLSYIFVNTISLYYGGRKDINSCSFFNSILYKESERSSMDLRGSFRKLYLPIIFSILSLRSLCSGFSSVSNNTNSKIAAFNTVPNIVPISMTMSVTNFSF